MPNTLTDVAPKILAQGLIALRGMNCMPVLVNSDYAAEYASKGLTVDVPIPSAVAAQDVTPAAVPPTTPDVAPTTAKVTLNQWKEAPFYMTDKDMQQAMDGVIPMQASEAIKALADAVNSYLFSLYVGVYGFAGTPGTTPFASDTTAATAIRKVLNKQYAPMDPRRMVLDPDSEANALNLRAFQDTSWSASPSVIAEGKMTRKLGFDWFMDQQVPTHTAGTITTGLICKAATVAALSATTLTATTAASTGACNLKIGDIITFAGDSQTYVLTAVAVQAAAATDVALAFLPGLKVAKAGSEAISVKGNHVVNLAFHRDAFAFASRLLSDNEGLGNVIQVATDPISKIALRLEISREHKRTRFAYDILFGGTLIRPDLAGRLAG